MANNQTTVANTYDIVYPSSAARPGKSQTLFVPSRANISPNFGYHVSLLPFAHPRPIRLLTTTSDTAHLLASSAMILLRCTVETTDTLARETCKQSLESLRKRLRSARDEDDWDLADIFLNQCDEPISRVIGKLDNPTTSSAAAPISPRPPQQENIHAAINVEDVVLQPLQQDFVFDFAGGGLGGADLGFSFEGLGLPFDSSLWNGGFEDGGDGMGGF